MKTIIFIGLLCILLIPALSCGGNGEQQRAKLPDAYKLTVNWAKSYGEGEIQFWVKGEKWREDWNATEYGVKTNFIAIFDGQSRYSYNPFASKVWEYAPSAMTTLGAPYIQTFEAHYYGIVSDETILADLQTACSGGAYSDGRETIAGQACKKFTCNLGEGISHLWITDNGWLLKKEVTQGGNTHTMQFSDVVFNPYIDDSIFDISLVAPGIPIIDAPN